MSKYAELAKRFEMVKHLVIAREDLEQLGLEADAHKGKDWLDGYEAGVQAAEPKPAREQQRFTAAVAAMQAILASNDRRSAHADDFAADAVHYADGLLAALDGGAK